MLCLVNDCMHTLAPHPYKHTRARTHTAHAMSALSFLQKTQHLPLALGNRHIRLSLWLWEGAKDEERPTLPSTRTGVVPRDGCAPAT